MKKTVVIGKIRRPHGLKGEVVVEWSNGVCPIKLHAEVFLQCGADKHAMKLLSTRGTKNPSIVTFDRIRDRTHAEKLSGAIIHTYESNLPALKRNEYYVRDLLGLGVITDCGKRLGKVTKIFSTGSNDVYEVSDGSKTYLLPAIESVIKEIDLANKLITVSIPEGLLD